MVAHVVHDTSSPVSSAQPSLHTSDKLKVKPASLGCCTSGCPSPSWLQSVLPKWTQWVEGTLGPRPAQRSLQIHRAQLHSWILTTVLFLRQGTSKDRSRTAGKTWQPPSPVSNQALPSPGANQWSRLAGSVLLGLSVCPGAGRN